MTFTTERTATNRMRFYSVFSVNTVMSNSAAFYGVFR